MYEKGYSKEEIIALFDFIDWIIKLRDDEEERIIEEVRNLEKVKNMPYLNSLKRLAIREVILEVLNYKFGEIPLEIADTINQEVDEKKLKSLHRFTIQCSSIEEFKNLLENNG